MIMKRDAVTEIFESAKKIKIVYEVKIDDTPIISKPKAVEIRKTKAAKAIFTELVELGAKVTTDDTMIPTAIATVARDGIVFSTQFYDVEVETRINEALSRAYDYDYNPIKTDFKK